MKRVYPVPELGPTGLIPKYNPEIWQPNKNDVRRAKFGATLTIGKKKQAPNLDLTVSDTKK